MIKEWIKAGVRDENYSQIVIMPATLISEDYEGEINSYVREHIHMKHDLLAVGCVATNHINGDGTKRIDGVMLIHNEDIVAFGYERFGLSIPLRWLEDILGNDMERGLQTYSNDFLCAYPPTWTYSDEKWDSYECYEGTWAVGA